MKNLILAIILLISTSLSAQVSSQSETSEQIKKVIQTLVDAWSEGDAESFASNFTENADFTVWFGMQLNGQKEIAFGHSIIFKEFYANTKWDLNINKIRFIGEDYALVHCSGSVLKKGTKNSDEPDAVPLLIF
ncbi:MAG: SgcJ/EcaC family oxidoreductase, partial [Maribacter sp.]|nr:SgcJ/EcaC family oxidoreductase [Maribacter sp.]